MYELLGVLVFCVRVDAAACTNNNLRYEKISNKCVASPLSRVMESHDVTFHFTSPPGSPFVQEIAELGRPVAHGDGLYRGVPGRPLTFTVDPRGNPGPVTVDIEGRNQPV